MESPGVDDEEDSQESWKVPQTVKMSMGMTRKDQKCRNRLYGNLKTCLAHCRAVPMSTELQAQHTDERNVRRNLRKVLTGHIRAGEAALKLSRELDLEEYDQESIAESHEPGQNVRAESPELAE